MGLLIGCVGIGNSVGPIIAGVAGGLGEWRLFCLTNVILGLVTLVTALKFIPDDADSEEDPRIDYAGVAVLSLALLSLLYAMDVGAGTRAPRTRFSINGKMANRTAETANKPTIRRLPQPQSAPALRAVLVSGASFA